MVENQSSESSKGSEQSTGRAKIASIIWVGLSFVVVGLLLGVNKGASFFAWIFLVPGFILCLVALVKGLQPKRLALGGVIGSVVVFFIAVGVSIGSLSAGGSSDTSASDSSSSSSTESDKTPSPTPEKIVPTVVTKVFNGNGDSVVKFELSDAAIITFICNGCDGNTVLKTDGEDSLLVNEIGPYAGSRIVNTSDGALITKFTIKADSDWALTIADITTAKTFNGPASGHGDTVVLFKETFDTATIKNVGEHNFIVYGYGGGRRDLVVNEIGSYKGTVSLVGPGFVQVRSSGDWTITPE